MTKGDTLKYTYAYYYLGQTVSPYSSIKDIDEVLAKIDYLVYILRDQLGEKVAEDFFEEVVAVSLCIDENRDRDDITVYQKNNYENKLITEFLDSLR